MIVSVVEAIYDDYAKANFTNYELRREDFKSAGVVRPPIQQRARISLAVGLD